MKDYEHLTRLAEEVEARAAKHQAQGMPKMARYARNQAADYRAQAEAARS